MAPFASDPDFYLYDGTRGIRPQSIYPSPFAVAEALIRTSQEFREAFLQDWRQAVLTWPDLPLDRQEREALLWEPICKRLEWVARNV